MTYQTAEEQLGSYVEKLGNELGPIFHRCRQKFIATTSVWDIYCVLIGNKGRVDLLNSCNGLKKVRDKVLAHNDFGRATGDDEPLEIESRKVISEIFHVQAIIERATYSQLLKMSCNKLLTI